MGRIDRPSIIRVDCAVNRGSISSLHFGRCCLGLSVRLHGPKVTFDNLPVNALQTAPVTWGPAGLCWSLTKPSHISPYCVVILVCFYSALRLQPKKSFNSSIWSDVYFPQLIDLPFSPERYYINCERYFWMLNGMSCLLRASTYTPK